MRQLELFPEESMVVTKPANATSALRVGLRTVGESTPLSRHAAEPPGPRASTEVIDRTAERAIDETPALILRALHSTTAIGWRAAVDELLLPEERLALEAAESLGLRLQQCHLFDLLVHRLTLDWAKAIGWPEAAIAEVVEPAVQHGPNLRAITLRLQSRALQGRVCFRISQPADVAEPIPPAALAAAADTRHYWKEIRYLEPLFAGETLLRSQQEVMQHYARPKDPLIVGFLGAGPKPNYGLRIPQLHSRQGRTNRLRSASTPFRVFLIAHYD